jgi:WD40 repeat protein
LNDPPDVAPLVLKELDSLLTGESGDLGPGGRWLVRYNGHRFTFWPLSLPRRRALPIKTPASTWSVQFSPDGRWLASCPIGEPARLWPMDARDRSFRDLLPGASCMHIAIDPPGSHVAVSTWMSGNRVDGRVFLYPIDGKDRRELLTGWEGENYTFFGAFDSTGRQLVAKPATRGVDPNDPKCRTFRVWDTESGVGQTVSLPECAFPAGFDAEGRVVYGDGSGVRRLVSLESPGGTPSSEMLFPFPNLGPVFLPILSRDGRQLLVLGTRREEHADTPAQAAAFSGYKDLMIVDMATHAARRITTHGARLVRAALDPSGRFIVTGDLDGVVRVGPVSGEEPHLLPGHVGMNEAIAISPDGRWIASTGEDQLFLWPTPDLSKPPLHTLALDQLFGKLRSLTNLRAVRDPDSPGGWKIEVGPFPGWKEVPTW